MSKRAISSIFNNVTKQFHKDKCSEGWNVPKRTQKRKDTSATVVKHSQPTASRSNCEKMVNPHAN